ncbi:MAG: ABC transporter ATP-binding protein [Candidatus Zixiibacteriota bacterium]
MRHGRGFVADESLGKVFDKDLVKKMFKYARPYYKYMAIALFVILISAASEIIRPYIQKMAIDRHIMFNNRLLDPSKLPEEDRARLDSQYADILYKVETDPYSVIFQRDIDSYSGDMIRAYVDLGRPLSIVLPIEFQKQRYIVDPSKLDMLDAAKWKKIEAIDSLRILLVDTLDQDKKYGDALRAIVQRNSMHFGSTDRKGMLYLSIAQMSKLSRDELRMIRGKDINGVVFFGMIFFAIVLLTSVVNFTQIYLLAWIGQRIMKDIRMDLFDHLQRLSLRYFDSNPIGRLVTRATNDVRTINEMFTSVAVNLFRDIFMFVGLSFVIFSMNWRLALVLWATMPIIIVSTIIFRMKVRKAYLRVRRELAVINATLSEHFAGVKTIKLFVREAKNIVQFSRKVKNYYDANMRQLYIMAVFRPVMSVMHNVGIALIMWYGGGQVLRTVLPLGALVAFIGYVRMFFQPINGLAEKFNIMQSAMASSERIVKILETQPDIKQIENPQKPDKVEGELKFENVWFSYSDKKSEWVLKDISFNVKPGETVALVGETGAGKTTITNLLPRFYDIQKGKIQIDGIDIKNWDIKALRENIGIVLQDVFIFASDVKSNIRLNQDREIADEKVIEAAKIVNADYFINKLPNGYDEIMHERGATLSTGQKQLLSFARVLAFDPKILILDEATSNIDTETEKLIQDALEKLLEGRTSVIVAHRLSTIKNADRIIVLDDGKIVEEGDHQELLAKRGIYYNLYLLQFAKHDHHSQD